MIEITTDSCCDLSPALIKQHQIRVINLNVFINGRDYKDGELTQAELFALADESGELPKTSAPSISEFVNLFDTPNDKLFIGISDKLSATLQNAIKGAEMANQPVRIIDSMNLSTGIGLLVLKAAELRDQGRTIDEIKEIIERTVPYVRTAFVIDTLDYLYKGGRCTAMQHVVGSMLRLRPVIEVRADGTLGVKEKIGGSRKKALNSMLESFKRSLPGVDLHRVFVTHTSCEEDAEYLKAELLKLAPIEEVCITEAGATIASHCGPNTIGILYILKAE